MLVPLSPSLYCQHARSIDTSGLEMGLLETATTQIEREYSVLIFLATTFSTEGPSRETIFKQFYLPSFIVIDVRKQ